LSTLHGTPEQTDATIPFNRIPKTSATADRRPRSEFSQAGEGEYLFLCAAIGTQGYSARNVFA